jgi:type IV pilus assembly protein PilQ
MKNSVKDFIFGDGNTMNQVFRQFSMGAIAIAVMQAASAQVSMTNIVPMQIPGQGTEIRVMFNGLPPQPQAYQLEQPSRLILDFDNCPVIGQLSFTFLALLQNSHPLFPPTRFSAFI